MCGQKARNKKGSKMERRDRMLLKTHVEKMSLLGLDTMLMKIKEL
jgi:hypothetical protein